MFPTSILQGTYNQSNGGGDGGSSPFTGLIFGYNHTITPSGSLGIYEDDIVGAPAELVGIGNPFYFIQFGPGTFDSDQNARALNYSKDLVSWITDRAVANVALDTNYNITTSDFSRLTVGSGGTNGDGNFSFTFAFFEPASSGTYIKLTTGWQGREYALRFYGGWTVNSGLNDGTAGASSVPNQYWKKTT